MKSFSSLIGITLALAAGVGTYVFFNPSLASGIRNYPSSGTDIIALGDSLVAGTGGSDGHDFVTLLAEKIGQPIVNLGVSGDTSAKALERISALDDYKPKVVIVLLGGNDRLRGIPQEETFANLAEIIENIQNRGAIVLLLGIRGAILTDPYAEEFYALRQKHGTAYVPDVLSGLIGRSQYMSDRVHPNDAGYARIAERVYPELDMLLR